MNKKIYIVRGKDEEELANNINNFGKESFATQGFQLKKGWCAYIYCNEGYTQKTEKVSQNGSKPQIEPISEKQRNFLLNHGYQGNMDLTKAEVHALIKSAIEGQKREKYDGNL